MGHISSPPPDFGGSVIMILIVRTPNIKKVEEWQLKILENVDQNVPIAEKIMLKYQEVWIMRLQNFFLMVSRMDFPRFWN